MRHFLIDTDTASDDAVALVMALTYPDVQVEAITVVAGNVPVDQGVQNALYTVALCDKEVPVYRGVAVPLLRPLKMSMARTAWATLAYPFLAGCLLKDMPWMFCVKSYAAM